MTTPGQDEPEASEPTARGPRAVIWLPGLAVALGAAAATAHGLYEVAIAARVPAAIAWLYPLITDGLALVAYAATARLRGGAARYAWAVVVLAAGLSGLAQAAFLAGDPASQAEAPAALRFGVGAWPAICAAIAAHLLYLLTAPDHAGPSRWTAAGPDRPVPSSTTAAGVHTAAGGVQPAALNAPPIQLNAADATPAAGSLAVQPAGARAWREHGQGTRPEQENAPAGTAGAAPARERARAAAQRHHSRHRALPTVSELEALAQVSRGTAAAALKDLRDQSAPLHIITSQTPETTENDDERAQP